MPDAKELGMVKDLDLEEQEELRWGVDRKKPTLLKPGSDPVLKKPQGKVRLFQAEGGQAVDVEWLTWDDGGLVVGVEISQGEDLENLRVVRFYCHDAIEAGRRFWFFLENLRIAQGKGGIEWPGSL